MMRLRVHPFTNGITFPASEFPGRMNKDKSTHPFDIKSLFLLATILTGPLHFVQVVYGPMCVRVRPTLCCCGCFFNIACEVKYCFAKMDNRRHMAAIWKRSLAKAKCHKSWDFVPYFMKGIYEILDVFFLKLWVHHLSGWLESSHFLYFVKIYVP